MMRTNVIGGAAVQGVDASANRNPSDVSDVVGEYAVADAAQAEAAIASASEAFPAWSRTTGQQRFDILDRAGDEVLRRKDELGDLLAREEGKTLPEAVGEVDRAGQIL